MKTAQESISGFFERDHDEIDAIFRGIDSASPKEALRLAEEFDRRLERHIGWEEDILFPAVVARGPQLELGPIRVMGLEHQWIRRQKTDMLEALRRGDLESARAAAASLRGSLGEHNAKEEQVLYPACDELLDAGTARGILAKIREGIR